MENREVEDYILKVCPMCVSNKECKKESIYVRTTPVNVSIRCPKYKYDDKGDII